MFDKIAIMHIVYLFSFTYLPTHTIFCYFATTPMYHIFAYTPMYHISSLVHTNLSHIGTTVVLCLMLSRSMVSICHPNHHAGTPTAISAMVDLQFREIQVSPTLQGMTTPTGQGLHTKWPSLVQWIGLYLSSVWNKPVAMSLLNRSVLHAVSLIWPLVAGHRGDITNRLFCRASLSIAPLKNSHPPYSG